MQVYIDVTSTKAMYVRRKEKITKMIEILCTVYSKLILIDGKLV